MRLAVITALAGSLALEMMDGGEAILAAPSARALAKQTEVYVGEAFVFQIQVSEGGETNSPDLSALTNFVVEALGGGGYYSESSSSINGRSTRTADHGYTFNYNLTPTREGRLEIPGISITVGKRPIRTQPVFIISKKPVDIDHFKLRLEPSKTNCYVGEPVLLDIVWYLDQEAFADQITLPLADSNSFQLIDADPQTGPTRPGELRLGNRVVKFEEGQGLLDGKSFRTIRVHEVLIPKTAGHFSVEPATLTFNMPTTTPSGSQFTSGSGARGWALPFASHGSCRKVVIPSNPLSLSISPLPAEGRPANFAGAVGRFSIGAEATPRNVNMGDPITLSVTVTGAPYAGLLTLPPLHKQPAFTNDFKVAADVATAKTVGRDRAFTQILRALRAEVKEIPAVELPYFDPDSRVYRVARSQPIPLQVKSVKVVRAAEGEGVEATKGQTGPAFGGLARRLATLAAAVVRPVWRAARAFPAVWIGLLVVGPAAWWGWRALSRAERQKRLNPAAAPAHEAFGHLNATLESASPDDCGSVSAAVLSGLRTYLAGKLELNPAALTFRDVCQPLAAKGIDVKTLAATQDLFRRCEAIQFAHAYEADPAALLQRCREVAEHVERAAQPLWEDEQ